MIDYSILPEHMQSAMRRYAVAHVNGPATTNHPHPTRSARMPTAICNEGHVTHYRNSRGTRLADMRCQCGESLRKAAYDPDRGVYVLAQTNTGRKRSYCETHQRHYFGSCWKCRCDAIGARG